MTSSKTRAFVPGMKVKFKSNIFVAPTFQGKVGTVIDYAVDHPLPGEVWIKLDNPPYEFADKFPTTHPNRMLEILSLEETYQID